jgi:hypothetical protein
MGIAIEPALIVTVSTETSNQAFDITDGVVGYDPMHAPLFAAKVYHALASGGGVIVRQFTDETEQVDGQTLPIKNLYGFCCKGGVFAALSVEELRDAMETDCRTGKQLPREEAVRYLDYSQVEDQKK